MTTNNAPSRARIVDLITGGVRTLLSERGHPVPDDLGESTRLIGEQVLSSLELVSVIVMVEEALQDEHDISVTIADERAMSRSRSPFRTVGALADYVCELVAEETAGA
jgi:acyl carrier protein